MEYTNIWNKVLSGGEEVKYEFSVGKRLRMVSMGIWLFLTLITIFIPPLWIFLVLLTLFYFGFYMKVANAYAFTNNRVLVHKGWLSTKLISTEYQKITDVTVEEPFLMRVFYKAGSLTINTAGTGTKEIVLKYVEQPYEVKKKLDELRTNL